MDLHRLCRSIEMNRISLLLVLTATLLLPVSVAQATPITFVASLTQALEVPPTGSPGTGSALVVLDPIANTLHVEVTFSGLESTTIASHIHCCLSSPFLTGANVMVATTTPTFPGFPLGVTAGSYIHDFNLLDQSTYNPAFITSVFNPSGTVAGAEAALIAGIENGETYLNIHTNMFPGGEIRGFLVKVPEPTSLLLLGLGLLGLALMPRHRKPIARS